MFDGQSFSVESFSADAWFGLQAQTPAPQYQRIGGGGRRRGRRVLIHPGDPIQTELFPLVPQHENVIPLIQPATTARTRAIRRHEEEILLAA